MSLNFLEELKKAPPKKRAKLLHEMHEKNVKFFTRRNPELGNLLQNAGTGGYNIGITDDFLEITHLETGMLCHPKTGLERYVKELGSPHHTGWIDKLKVTHFEYTGLNFEHGQKLANFLDGVYPHLPIIQSRIASGEISLPKAANKKRFSGLTIFLGTFLGFHVSHYLLNTEVKDIVLVEPDIQKFVLSCWLLDFASIEKHFGRLVLHVGPEMPEAPESMINNAGITSSAWLRLLPAYPSQLFDEVIQRMELRWRALSEIFVPFDREVRNLGYGIQNLQQKQLINNVSPSLSVNSRIVVVASGPSLDKNMDWLRENKDKLIIFAAHSAVKSLKKNGIKPDFQCSLDTELEDTLLDKLELDFEIPFISYYKAKPESLKKFKKVLLINEGGKANPVKFLHPLYHTHPTTGNLATSTAVFLKPKKLYFLGLDLGTKNIYQDHVSGYWAENNIENQLLNKPSTEQLEILGMIPTFANFPESEGQVYTTAYHNNARNIVESLLAQVKKDETAIFNLSDGAKISYTQAIHSSELTLTPYPEKQEDINRIFASFSSESVGLWKPYKNSLDIILQTMSEKIAKSLQLKKFEWIAFTRQLDIVLHEVVQACSALEAGDIRVEAYHKLVIDLLVEWFRLMIFTNSQKEAELIYKIGLEKLLTVLHSLKTPMIIQAFEQEINDNLPPASDNYALENFSL